MTDTPTPSEHDPIAAAMRAARADVEPVSGDELVAAVRNAKTDRARHHRRATGGVLGAVAALILVAFAAVALQDQPSSQVVKSGAPTHDPRNGEMLATRGKIAFGLVTVMPSTGLVDGQTVSVSATGFDAGTSVTFLECTPTSADSGSTTSAPQPKPGATDGSVEPQSGSAGSSTGNPNSSGPATENTKAATPDVGRATDMTEVVGSGDRTRPAEPGSAPDTLVANGSNGLVPGWRCADPSKRATRTKASDADPAVEGGHLTTATATMPVAANTDGFYSRVYRSGIIDIPKELMGYAPRACVDPTAIPSPPASLAPSSGSDESTPPAAGSGADGTTSDAPDAGNTSSAGPSVAPMPDADGACVIIAIGMFGGTQTVYSSQPLSFGDAPTGPATSVPSPTVVPPTDPTPCPDNPAGTSCPPAVDPPTTAPSLTECPTNPPVPGYTNSDHSQPLLDFTPTSITICHLPAAELGAPPMTVTSPARIKQITDAIGALNDVPGPKTACTTEMGDSLVLVAEAGSKRTVIQAQFYGCDEVTNGSAIRLGAESLRWIYALSPTG